MPLEQSVHRLGPQRNPDIDIAVLAAARRLLVERGYANTSIDAIATAAGVGRPAIYRRWPSKAHLVHEVIYPVLTRPSVQKETVAEQVDALIGGAVALFGDPAARAAVPGLIGETRADPGLHEMLVSAQLGPIRAELAQRVREGVAAAELRPGVDPDALLDVIAGAVIFALCVRDGPASEPPASDAAGSDGRSADSLAAVIADIVLNGILPR